MHLLAVCAANEAISDHLVSRELRADEDGASLHRSSGLFPSNSRVVTGYSNIALISILNLIQRPHATDGLSRR